MSKIPPRLRWLLPCVLVVVAGAGFWILRQRAAGTASPPAPRSIVRAATAAALTAADSDPRPSRAGTTPAVPALFTFVEPAEAAELDRALPAPSRDVRYVQVDRALVAGKQSPFWQKPGVGRVEVPLPEGGSVTVAIDDSEMLGADRFTSTGRIEGRPASRALFAWNGGYLNASIEEPGRGTLALRTATSGLAQFYRVDPALVPACGGERRPRLEGAAPVRAAAETSTTPAMPGVAAAENPQHAEVHMLMLYTQAVLPTMSGKERVAALQSAFDLAAAKINSAFEASLITARVKLVGLAETQYDESVSVGNKVQDDALTALYQENDGKMDEIHALRNRVGADTVCLALDRRDSVSSGLSFLLDTPGDLTNPRFAFSVVQYSFIAGTNVVPHELGHVLGCAHDRQNALSGQGAFSYSYGYRFIGADGRQYHDIMSYPPGVELSYFSNPAVVVPAPVNVPIGLDAGQPGESNTALTIEKTAFATSAYRLQTQATAAAGKLINVATRAYVGTGDQVLIGGFVVEGAQPKRMLIRAAGPALRAFGVSDALSDPLLRVMASGVTVAENDNWATPTGTGTPATAADIATQSKAFAFAPGSADSAVLVTLPPGAYSAVVEGKAGATGSGMIEAYEVEANAAKIINLSSRGYAARDGKEMVAGFVVEAPAGTTKRVLIRVLGPTLGRAPFNMTGVLDDPEMELHNGAGDLLIVNDDWSTAAEGGASVENDFNPVLDLYGEKQIAATGLAPKNRREPCVLADLPPGNYTVIVRPFESLSSNPLRDQPAAPGVGIVEVYEIKQ